MNRWVTSDPQAHVIIKFTAITQLSLLIPHYFWFSIFKLQLSSFLRVCIEVSLYIPRNKPIQRTL
jgi:hypothetical protein